MRRLMVMAVLVALAVGAHGATAAEVRVNGAIPPIKQVIEPAKDAIQTETGLGLVIVANGSNNGLKDLIGGRADIASLGAEFADVGAKVKKDVPDFDPTQYKAFRIGESPASLIVHPSNPVGKLGGDQIRGLVTGSITNWKDVGGPDSPVVVVAGPAGSGARVVVEQALLKGESLLAGREVPNLPLVTTVVKQLPGALGIVIANAVTPEVKVVETDVKFVQPLILVTKGEPSGDVKKVVDAILARAKN